MARMRMLMHWRFRFADALREGLNEAAVATRIYTAPEAKRACGSIREFALGATAFVPGRGTGWEGWDDSAVEPAKLGSYLRQISALMKEFDYHSPMYGHFGQGCIHMRHNFDLESAEAGILRVSGVSFDRAADIVRLRMEARSPASMGMGRRVERCCRRCFPLS